MIGIFFAASPLRSRADRCGKSRNTAREFALLPAPARASADRPIPAARVDRGNATQQHGFHGSGSPSRLGVSLRLTWSQRRQRLWDRGRCRLSSGRQPSRHRWLRVKRNVTLRRRQIPLHYMVGHRQPRLCQRGGVRENRVEPPPSLAWVILRLAFAFSGRFRCNCLLCLACPIKISGVEVFYDTNLAPTPGRKAATWERTGQFLPANWMERLPMRCRALGFWFLALSTAGILMMATSTVVSADHN